MGPPPPPPPPPPAGIVRPAVVAQRGRTAAHAPRRHDNPLPAQANASQRPTIHAEALQHAASRLRKTVNSEQILGDVADLSDGGVGREDQPLSGRDRSHSAQLVQLGAHPTREPLSAAPTGARDARSLGHLHRASDAIRHSPANITPVPPPHQNIDVFDSTPTPKLPYQTFNNSSMLASDPSSAHTNVVITTKTVTTTSSNNNNSHQPAVPGHLPTSNISNIHASAFEPALPQSSQSEYASINKQYSSNFSNTHSNNSTNPINNTTKNNNNNYVLKPVSKTTPSTNETVVEWTEQYNPNTPPAPPPILDPRARIHDYATTTYVRDTQSSPTANQQLAGRQTTLTDRRPSNGQSNLVRQLRDESLTASQRFANQFQRSQRRDEQLPFDVHSLIQQSYKGDQVDALVQQMHSQLGGSSGSGSSNMLSSAPESRSNSLTQQHNQLFTRTGRTSSSIGGSTSLRGHVCVSCGKEITADNPGCTALDQVFHVSCFVCKKCQRVLAGASFYNIDNAPTCETCYLDTLEKCTACGKTITDKLLRACGGTFHVQCFVCTACKKPLDGVPFTVDSENNVHCVPCFHDKFAPRCAMCSKAIIPEEGQKESVRVVAMDKSFHPACYKCEDCGLQLSSKIEGQGCYPLDSHLYCKTCNGNRLRMMSAAS